jgi:hypothetical protein
MNMLSTPGMACNRGKESLVAVKKVITREVLRSGDTTSKYHHSGVVPLTGWSLGPSRELEVEMKSPMLGAVRVVVGMATVDLGARGWRVEVAEERRKAKRMRRRNEGRISEGERGFEGIFGGRELKN